MTADELAWQEFALCAQTDPEIFTPDKGGSTRAAKAVCAACDVTAQCLAYALAHDERFGVWGGLSENDRKKLRKGTYIPGQIRPAGHGSRIMYTRGCKDETVCPGNADGRTCSQAYRDYQNKWEARKRANGGRAA